MRMNEYFILPAEERTKILSSIWTAVTARHTALRRLMGKTHNSVIGGCNCDCIEIVLQHKDELKGDKLNA